MYRYIGIDGQRKLGSMSSMSPYQSSVHANYNTYCWCLSLVKHEIKDHFPLTQQLAVLINASVPRPLRILITVHKNDFIVLSLSAAVSIEIIIVSFPPSDHHYVSFYYLLLISSCPLIRPRTPFPALLTCLTATVLYNREIWWVK